MCWVVPYLHMNKKSSKAGFKTFAFTWGRIPLFPPPLPVPPYFYFFPLFKRWQILNTIAGERDIRDHQLQQKMEIIIIDEFSRGWDLDFRSRVRLSELWGSQFHVSIGTSPGARDPWHIACHMIPAPLMQTSAQYFYRTHYYLPFLGGLELELEKGLGAV